MNNLGPFIVPWGTPQVIVLKLDNSLPILVHWDLLVKKDIRIFISDAEIPIFINLVTSIVWSI